MDILWGVFDSTNWGYLVKYDKFGDTLWTKKIGDPIDFTSFAQAIETKDGGYIAVGAYQAVGQRSDGWLVKTDSLGNVQWQKRYSTTLGTQESLSSVVDTYDGGYILGGNEQEFPNQPTRNYDPILIKVDSLGNQQWRQRYDTPFDDATASVFQTYDSNYIFASGVSVSGSSNSTRGRPALYKIDQNGNLLWRKTYGNFGFSTALLSVKQLEDSSLIAAGRTGILGPNCCRIDGVLVHANQNGDSIFVETYERFPGMITNWNFLWDVIPLDNGGFMACGEYINTSSPVIQDAWVIRVDSMGCIQSNCTVGLNDVRSEVLEEQVMNLYPNPTNGIVNLETSLALDRIEVFDLQGKLVQRLAGITKQIELPEQGGLYFIRLYVEDGSIGNYKVLKN